MRVNIILILLSFCVYGCSTSSTTISNWKSKSFQENEIGKLLIFAKTEDKKLQHSYETKIAQEFYKLDISPIKMHEEFPEFKYKIDYSKEDIDSFIVNCQKRNIKTVLLASQKSKLIDTIFTNSFRNYLNSLEALSLDSHNDLVYDKKEVITYTLEAIIYDLSPKSEENPLAITTLKAKDPKSLKSLEVKFLKSIKKLFLIK